TFEPHPVVFFKRTRADTFRLTSPEHKLALLAEAGITRPVAIPFDRRLASMAPEDFVDDILYQCLGAQRVRVGYDFNFGRGRSGGPEDLKRYARERGIITDVHPPVEQHEDVISSTRIRTALSSGDLNTAQALLGRPHALRGTIVAGDRRGATLGFPTANIVPAAGMMIPHGVYITQVRLLDGPSSTPLFPAITNVGVKPTFQQQDDPQANAESFILAGLPKEGINLYDRPIEVVLVDFIRAEQRFASVEALKAQIGQDVQQARAFHGLGDD
ncbi:MAG: riboflavin biosynthesis protein RibF, partial [Myxococcota bacterium]